jgi:hypothetical protein
MIVVPCFNCEILYKCWRLLNCEEHFSLTMFAEKEKASLKSLEVYSQGLEAQLKKS